jgi:uncharacterized repeat protein (TIGR01451 family)
MEIRGWVVALAAVLALAAPAAAAADTTIGITSPPAGATANGCPASPQQILFAFAGSPVSGPLTVPSSPGPLAVTHWAVNAAGVTANEQLTLVVMRIQFSATPTITIVGIDTETLTPPASPAGNVENFTLSQPIAVQAGDIIAQYAPGATPGLTCYWSGGAGQTNEVEGLPQAAPPTVGEQFGPGAVGVSSDHSDLNLSATLSPVTYDAGLSLTAAPSNAVVGQPAVLTATVTNGGPLPGPVTFTDPVPSGLTVDYAAASSGSCTTSTVNIVTCSLPNVAPGQSEKIAIVVTPTAAQSYSDSGAVSLTGGGNDPNAANNSATTTLAVSKAGAPTKCSVPKLAGASLALAKRVLPMLGCKVGKVKKATSKSVPKGEVISTNPRAGSYPAGQKVAITVSSGKPKKHHKK